MLEPAPSYDTTRPEERDEGRISVHYDTRPPQLSPWRRMQIPVIGATVYSVVRLLGPTMRFEVLGAQHVERVHSAGQRCILAFWHRHILTATWWWRQRGIVVLNTTNFDGQWTRRVIERLGYGTAQGSSSRGGLRGLAMMARALEGGRDVAFTIDGPRGPRFVAKPGPVMLARKTGCPILPFHFGLEHAHTFENTWDLFQVPHPFTRAVLFISAPIHVAHDANREEVERKHAEMQAALDRVRERSEGWFAKNEAERRALRVEWNK